VKSVLDQGPEPCAVAPSPNVGQDSEELTAGLLGLREGDILEVLDSLEVQIVYFYRTRRGEGTAHIRRGQQVTVRETPTAGSVSILLEAVDGKAFESTYVPGGIRSHESYTGYGLVVSAGDVARHFRPAGAEDRGE